MPEIIVYITQRDADALRDWLNAEPAIAWIVVESRSGCDVQWKAVHTIPTIASQDYCLWHTESGPLNIPSGSLETPDAHVLDPFVGWRQRLTDPHATVPWFGANLPGPYVFRFREKGCEAPDAIGRSGFLWSGDRFKAIGKVASPAARTWWTRLARHIRSNAAAVPWPYPKGIGRRIAYAFPDAHQHIRDGRPVDVNP